MRWSHGQNHLHLCFCLLQSAPNCLLTTPLFGIAFHCRTARKSLGRNPSGRGRGNLGKITCQKTIVHCATHCRVRPLRPAAHSLPYAEKSRRCASSLHPRPSNTIEPCLATAGLRGKIGSGLGGRGRIADVWIGLISSVFFFSNSTSQTTYSYYLIFCAWASR